VKGLTSDITENDLVQIFRRAGVIKLDPYTCSTFNYALTLALLLPLCVFPTGLPRIKLYRNEKGDLTGDALISFVHPDSVTLAIKYINGTELPNGSILTVEQVSTFFF
jgi:HIV Tat-specific factor 1